MKYQDAILGDNLPVFNDAGKMLSRPEGTTQLLGELYPELQGQNLRIIASRGASNELMVEIPVKYFDTTEKILDAGVPVDQLLNREFVRLIVRGSECTQGQKKPEPVAKPQEQEAYHPHEETVVQDVAVGARNLATNHIDMFLEGYSPYTQKKTLEATIYMMQTRLNRMVGSEYDQPQEDQEEGEDIYHRDDE